MDSIVVGNTAKSYCLRRIKESLESTKEIVNILDLGCGAALPFADLLKHYKNMRYVGV